MYNTTIYDNKQIPQLCTIYKMSKYLLVSGCFSILIIWFGVVRVYLEQANCDFAHVRDIVLQFDAKRVKYILN